MPARKHALPEAIDGDAVVWLVEKRQWGVIDQHCALQIPAQSGEVLDAGVQVT